jgi:hypothetical protein
MFRGRSRFRYVLLTVHEVRQSHEPHAGNLPHLAGLRYPCLAWFQSSDLEANLRRAALFARGLSGRIPKTKGLQEVGSRCEYYVSYVTSLH